MFVFLDNTGRSSSMRQPLVSFQQSAESPQVGAGLLPEQICSNANLCAEFVRGVRRPSDWRECDRRGKLDNAVVIVHNPPQQQPGSCNWEQRPSSSTGELRWVRTVRAIRCCTGEGRTEVGRTRSPYCHHAAMLALAPAARRHARRLETQNQWCQQCRAQDGQQQICDESLQSLKPQSWCIGSLDSPILTSVAFNTLPSGLA